MLQFQSYKLTLKDQENFFFTAKSFVLAIKFWSLWLRHFDSLPVTRRYRLTKGNYFVFSSARVSEQCHWKLTTALILLDRSAGISNISIFFLLFK